MDRSIPIIISKGNPFTRGQHLENWEAGRVRQASIAGKIGINASGLAVCVNLLKSDSDYKGLFLSSLRFSKPIKAIEPNHRATNNQDLFSSLSFISISPHCWKENV